MHTHVHPNHATLWAVSSGGMPSPAHLTPPFAPPARRRRMPPPMFYRATLTPAASVIKLCKAYHAETPTPVHADAIYHATNVTYTLPVLDADAPPPPGPRSHCLCGTRRRRPQTW